MLDRAALAGRSYERTAPKTGRMSMRCGGVLWGSYRVFGVWLLPALKPQLKFTQRRPLPSVVRCEGLGRGLKLYLVRTVCNEPCHARDRSRKKSAHCGLFLFLDAIFLGVQESITISIQPNLRF